MEESTCTRIADEEEENECRGFLATRRMAEEGGDRLQIALLIRTTHDLGRGPPSEMVA